MALVKVKKKLKEMGVDYNDYASKDRILFYDLSGEKYVVEVLYGNSLSTILGVSVSKNIHLGSNYAQKHMVAWLEENWCKFTTKEQTAKPKSEVKNPNVGVSDEKELTYIEAYVERIESFITSPYTSIVEAIAMFYEFFYADADFDISKEDEVKMLELFVYRAKARL